MTIASLFLLDIGLYNGLQDSVPLCVQNIHVMKIKLFMNVGKSTYSQTVCLTTSPAGSREVRLKQLPIQTSTGASTEVATETVKRSFDP